MKALLFFAFIILAFVVIKFTLKRLNQFREELTQQNKQQQTQKQPEQMVTCHQCGLHLPKKEALVLINTEEKEETKYACCEEHGS